ncbi:DHH phosphoesterase [Athelia psychrophila]|uniref:DHH phosphoesterase n=1 Tax=Athelia psychrophila TaxID=1759441 RepID=A0A166BD58_9AGAM|nr:DHH phosphoesterase [Fibularhizoctonia sp. CBS 109695]
MMHARQPMYSYWGIISSRTSPLPAAISRGRRWIRQCHPRGTCSFRTLSEITNHPPERRFVKTATTTSLSQFLSSSKARYLKDVGSGKGDAWTVIMGNEAGDLDSIASSIAYAWIRSRTPNVNVVPLIPTKREDMRLRGENMHALSLAGLQSGCPEVLCVDEVPRPGSGAFPSHSFGLVDHNRLLPQYTSANAKVLAVIDHHADEGFHKESDTSPRIVGPSGSCASHVALLCPADAEIPAGLATLLLSAILIDTGGLKVKAGGKTLPVDLQAAAFLLPISTIYDSSSIAGPPQPITSADDFAGMDCIANLKADLSEKKNDVSRLDSRDLLRRDYKEYRLDLSWAGPRAFMNAGISAAPEIGLKEWVSKDSAAFWAAAREWMQERDLGVLGVLTSVRGEKNHIHKHEQSWLIRDTAGAQVDADRIAEKLWLGLEASQELRLETKEFASVGTSKEEAQMENLKARVYNKRNAGATRKVTAPLMMSVLESP